MSRKLTQAEFLGKARAAHGDKYDYSQAVYTGNDNSIKIKCSTHGLFEQRAYNHAWRGQGCRKCAGSAPYTTESFIAKAREVHGDRYGYSQVVYTGKDRKVKILCRRHGLFEQAPDNHINASAGCRRCQAEGVARRSAHTTARFIENAQLKHGAGAYDYSLVNYTSGNGKVKIICFQHGVFEQTALTHAQGAGCALCGFIKSAQSQALTQEQFVQKAIARHGNAYCYSLAEYKRGRLPVTIICLRHGVFKQSPHQHMVGQGCPQCGLDSLKEGWVKKANGRFGLLYFIRLFDSQESFYKVGVTYKDIKTRYADRNRLGGYQYEILAVHKSLNAAAVWGWEQAIIETFTHLRYKPQKRFEGETECFSSADEILSIFPL